MKIYIQVTKWLNGINDLLVWVEWLTSQGCDVIVLTNKRGFFAVYRVIDDEDKKFIEKLNCYEKRGWEEYIEIE